MMSDQGRYSIVASENRLVVVDYPEVIKLVERLVEQMDVPRPQVRITSRIYDVSMKDLERLGINWNQTHNARYVGDTPQTVVDLNSITNAVVGGATNGALSLTNMSRYFDVEAVINALNTADDSRLLADPSVTVQNHDSARIRIVTEIPYQELTETDAGGAIGTTSFREAGVTLEVTPTVADDQTVHMVLTPSFSRLAGFTEGASPQPIIDQREATTSLRVPNRQTVVIGGLRQRSDVNKFTGIPRLKDVTAFGLGRLFKSYDSTVTESELVVFVTPEILVPNYSGTPREITANELTKHLLDRMPAASLDAGQCYGPNTIDSTVIPVEQPQYAPQEYPGTLVPQDVHEPTGGPYLDPAVPAATTHFDNPGDSAREFSLPVPVVEYEANRDFDQERKEFWKKSVERRPGPIESYGVKRRNPNIAWMMPRDGNWVNGNEENTTAKQDAAGVTRFPSSDFTSSQPDNGPVIVEPAVERTSNVSPYRPAQYVETADASAGLWLNTIFRR